MNRQQCRRDPVVLILLVALLGALWSAQSVTADKAGESPKVVFVCEHGSVKSLIAASYFNRIALQRGIPYRAIARGTAPESTVPTPVQEGLKEIGLDVSSYVPQLFQASDLRGASL